MASEVGSAYISIIPSASGFRAKLQRELGQDLTKAGKEGGKEYGKGFEDTAVDAAGGEKVSGGISDKLKNGLALGGAAAGAALVAGIGEALERGKLEDPLAVSVGARGRDAAKLGKVAGDLYAGAWGDSMQDVSSAVGGVVTSIRGMRRASESELESMTASVLDFATAFEIDATRATQVVGQMISTGLARNGRQAMDLLFASMQRVPAAVREDLLDAMDEYGPFMDALGMTGQEAMGLLVEGAEKGMYGIDKAGDAVKEFTIRATDMSTTTKDAYKTLGLDAEQTTNQILAGGDTAAGAFDKIVRGLLSIEDPGQRANTAIALFGTPMEDLSVAEIPRFLRSLRNTEDRLGRVAGTARRAGKQLNDNAATRFTQFKRTVETEFVNFIGDELIPAGEELWREVGPDMRRFGRSMAGMGEDIGPVVKDVLPLFARTLGRVAEGIGGIAAAFAKLPAPVQAALLSGGLFMLARRRWGGRGGVAAAGGLAAGTAAAGGAAAGAAAAGGGGGGRGGIRGGLGRGVTRLGKGLGVFTLLTRGGGEIGRMEQRGGLGPQEFVDSFFGTTKPKVDALTDSLAGGNRELARTAQIVKADLLESDVGQWATTFDINIDRLATDIAKFGGEGKYTQRVMRTLKGRTDGFGDALKSLNPLWETQELGAIRTQGALFDVLDGYRRAERGVGQFRRDQDKTRDSSGALVNLWRRNLIPSAKDLADRFNLGDREARGLREALLDTNTTGRGHNRMLRQVADQLGLNKDETRRLIREYGEVPRNINTDVNFNTRQADRERDAFLRRTEGKFAKLSDTTYAIMVNGTSGHGRIPVGMGMAEGGVLGRRERHDAQIAKPGTWRVWAEDETDGEAYIPLARSKRKRSLGIWAETGRRLGVEGFADGGIRGRLNTNVNLDLSRLNRVVDGIVRSLSFAGGQFPHDYRRINFRGVTLDRRSALMLRAAESLLGGQRFDLTQGSYNAGGVAASGGTHDGGGAFDAWSPFTRAAVVALRRVGWAAWRRYPNQGPWASHIHSIDPGNRMLSAAARSQAAAFRSGGDGLGGRDYEPRVAVMRAAPGAGGGGGGAQGPFNQYERYIIGRESGGSGGVLANNPSSTAFGLGQLTEANRVAAARALGMNWRVEQGDTGTTDRDAQIAMMRWYMNTRYGGARGAYNWHVNHGWYDNGGTLKPGWTMAYNGTGRDEYVVKPQPSRGPQRIVLDLGEGRKLTGWMDDTYAANREHEATVSRMR